jgi:hypothetical protein
MARSNFTSLLRASLRYTLYLAGLIFLPGALIGAPILLWLAHRRVTRSASTRQKAEGSRVGPGCVHCG